MTELERTHRELILDVLHDIRHGTHEAASEGIEHLAESETTLDASFVATVLSEFNKAVKDYNEDPIVNSKAIHNV